jgi:branched-chain amino acid transport system substrate-binding protein
MSEISKADAPTAGKPARAAAVASILRPSRRTLLAGLGAAATLPAFGRFNIVRAQGAPLKVGLMLPYSGTYAQLGENITAAFELLIAQKGGTLGGRSIEIIRLDDKSEPPKGPENMKRLVDRDMVDVVVGTVHSGVLMGMLQVARESGTLLIIPNAGAGAATGAQCAPNIFRSSFSNWQPAYGCGRIAADAGYKKLAYVTWDYAAGKESAAGFEQGAMEKGAEVVQVLTVPFPETNFQPILAQLPGLGVDAVGAFYAGGGAVQFVKDYVAAGLKDKLPLIASGFVTDGTLPAMGAAADGLVTGLHYADGLDTPTDNAFRAAFKEKAGREADVYAVQGYDAAQLLAVGLEAVQGDFDETDALHKAIASAKLDSPRGPMTLSPSHNPVHNIYRRVVKDGRNMVDGVAVEALADPGTGCTMT